METGGGKLYWSMFQREHQPLSYRREQEQKAAKEEAFTGAVKHEVDVMLASGPHFAPKKLTDALSLMSKMIFVEKSYYRVPPTASVSILAVALHKQKGWNKDSLLSGPHPNHDKFHESKLLNECFKWRPSGEAQEAQTRTFFADAFRAAVKSLAEGGEFYEKNGKAEADKQLAELKEVVLRPTSFGYRYEFLSNLEHDAPQASYFLLDSLYSGLTNISTEEKHAYSVQDVLKRWNDLSDLVQRN